jgi:hypothetical protein
VRRQSQLWVQHGTLSRYTPSNRFATAVFVVLSRDSGELTYVNAGHNSPIVFCDGSETSLEATGMPMGLLSGGEYEAGAAIVPFGSALLLFTDGLTDSISGNDPERSRTDWRPTQSQLGEKKSINSFSSVNRGRIMRLGRTPCVLFFCLFPVRDDALPSRPTGRPAAVLYLLLYV